MQLEVLHCYPTLRVVVCLPKRVAIVDMKIATRVAKCDTALEGFPIIKVWPFEGAITPQRLAELRTERPTPMPPPHWEVVAVDKSDATKVHPIGYERLLFETKQEAELSADFVKSFPYSLRQGMLVRVVPYEAERAFETANATEINTVV